MTLKKGNLKVRFEVVVRITVSDVEAGASKTYFVTAKMLTKGCLKSIKLNIVVPTFISCSLEMISK